MALDFSKYRTVMNKDITPTRPIAPDVITSSKDTHLPYTSYRSYATVLFKYASDLEHYEALVQKHNKEVEVILIQFKHDVLVEAGLIKYSESMDLIHPKADKIYELAKWFAGNNLEGVAEFVIAIAQLFTEE